MQYDWSQYSYQMLYNAQGYTRLYQFNPTYGLVIPNITDQFIYDTATGSQQICGACQRLANPTVMPPMGFLPGASLDSPGPLEAPHNSSLSRIVYGSACGRFRASRHRRAARGTPSRRRRRLVTKWCYST